MIRIFMNINKTISVLFFVVLLIGCSNKPESEGIDCELYPTHIDCLEIIDTSNPIFANIPMDFAITIGTEVDLLDLGLTANDDIDGNLTGSISVDVMDTSILNVGIHTVTYTVLDIAGNSNSHSLILTIEREDWVALGYEIFEIPDESLRSDKAEVYVNGREVFVYETRVNHAHIWSWDVPDTMNDVALFDFNENVEVEVVFDDLVEEVVIRPLSANIVASISGNTVTFTLSEPQGYVIEINGDTDNVLHLFTNYIDDDKPDLDNLPPNMMYYGPGIHNIGTVEVLSNKVVYLAGGAYISGRFIGFRVGNVTIRGRGIITGEDYVRDENNWFIPYEFNKSKDLVLDGITFLDPAGWVINSNFNTNVVINRINIITSRSNGDGISIQSNHDVFVTNSFVRTWDDSLVVKNYDNGTSSNIHFENITIWTDLAQSMEIGYETDGATMDNITFENITVIHNFHKAVISIHNGDQALITNVVFRNIIIEDAQMIGDYHYDPNDNFLIDITVVDSSNWSTSDTRGNVNYVTIENVTVIDGRDDLWIRVIGYDENHLVKNVTISNLVIKGQHIDDISDMNVYINAFVEDLVFE